MLVIWTSALWKPARAVGEGIVRQLIWPAVSEASPGPRLWDTAPANSFINRRPNDLPVHCSFEGTAQTWRSRFSPSFEGNAPVWEASKGGKARQPGKNSLPDDLEEPSSSPSFRNVSKLQSFYLAPTSSHGQQKPTYLAAVEADTSSIVSSPKSPAQRPCGSCHLPPAQRLLHHSCKFCIAACKCTFLGAICLCLEHAAPNFCRSGELLPLPPWCRTSVLPESALGLSF